MPQVQDQQLDLLAVAVHFTTIVPKHHSFIHSFIHSYFSPYLICSTTTESFFTPAFYSIVIYCNWIQPFYTGRPWLIWWLSERTWQSRDSLMAGRNWYTRRCLHNSVSSLLLYTWLGGTFPCTAIDMYAMVYIIQYHPTGSACSTHWYWVRNSVFFFQCVISI